MPFQQPLEVDNPGFPNSGQPTINVGRVAGAINVQGGGEILLNTSGTLGPSGVDTYMVDGPRSGLTYYGLGVIVTNTGKSAANDDPLGVYVFNFGTDGPFTKGYAGLMNAPGILKLGEFGWPPTVSLVVPVGTEFPIQVTVDQHSTGSSDYHILVVGLSQADVRARDLGMWDVSGSPSVIFNNAADESYAVIGASYETRDFLLVTSGTGGADYLVDVLDDFGVWIISQTRAHNSIYGGKVTGAGSVADTNSLITIPGNGSIHRIRNGTSAAGNLTRLTYLGMR